MKKATVVVLSIFCLFIFCCSSFSFETTSAPTPAEEASLLFARKLGTGYKNAPTPPAYANGCLYVAAGRYIYKLDAHTGETLAKTEMESISTYTAVPPLVAEDMVFMPLDDGIVQAFTADDLTPVWMYSDPLGGQSLTPILYVDGYLYTGFWNGETDDANYVCLTSEGQNEQNAVWTFSSKGGFYRTGAQQYGRFIVVGSENGERVNLPDASSNVYVLDRFSGFVASSIKVPGDVRAGIGYDDNADTFFAVSKGGALCRFQVDEINGTISAPVYCTLPGSSTITPVIYNGRIYTACANGRNGMFLVLDAEDLHQIYTAELPGMPQGDFLLSTAYEEFLGKVLIYTTYNAKPGGVYVFEDGMNQEEPSFMELFIPPEEMSQFCFCPLIAGEDGTLYYKNDSGNIFAISGTQIKTDSQVSVLQKLSSFLRFIMRVWRLLTEWYRL